MSIYFARIAVNNSTPTPVTDISDSYSSITLQIQNLGTGVAYVGGSNVSGTNYGASIAAGATLTIDYLPAGDEVYILHQDASANVGVIRVNR